VLACRADDLATLVVSGADRVSWLNGLVTCDLTTLTAGHAVYGLVVTKKGRILADLVLVARDTDVVVATSREIAPELRAALDHHLVMEDVEISSEGPLVWRVVGPRANEIVLAAPATVTAFDWVGLGGAIVLAPSEQAASTAEALAACVSSIGGAIGDADSWETLRIERGVPRYGADFDGTTYPQEASLEKRAVSFQKGCYLGQEVVCMLELRGHVKRKLVPLVLDSNVSRGAEVRDPAGVEVGLLTSVTASALNGCAGLAMVKLACAAPGTELSVGGVRARVLEPL
jgi:folate-binding protein YgfZ